MFNRGCYFDTKGGITFGNFSCAAENVKIFTHNHGEFDHMHRTYAPVVIGDFAKIYSGATILPGVTVGRQGLVGAESMVTKDVPENTLVVGIPAKAVRLRDNRGLDGEQLNHYWMKHKLFQSDLPDNYQIGNQIISPTIP
jgi:acetyltransferase-like isoleucine patch superfamily enzyme